MQSNPYLIFNGHCETAFKFYEQLLGGKITFMQTWGDSPAREQMPAEAQGLIMHVTLDLGGSQLMGADSSPGDYEEPRGMHVTLHFKEAVEGERIFQALAQGGKVNMAFQQTFFASGFGMCVDRFGIPWMVNCGEAA